MLFRDEWFGHRKPLSPLEKIGDRDEFIDWDFSLFDAVTTIENLTDQYGLLPWEIEDPDAEVRAVRKIHEFAASKDLATSRKNYKPAPGEYYVPDIVYRGEGEPQTYAEWIAKKIAEQEE